MESNEVKTRNIAEYSPFEVQRAAHRDHINNVYRVVFEKVDSDEVRGARHYVYEMDKVDDGKGGLEDRKPGQLTNLAFKQEEWLKLDTAAYAAGFEDFKKNRAKAEKIARALDQLGFLAREGIVPVNIIARFYTFPTLKCWYKLCPYIDAVRRRRSQKGHMWEWENLVNKIIASTAKEEGIWKGSRSHDNLENIVEQIKARTKALDLWTDEVWNPPDRSWVDE